MQIKDSLSKDELKENAVEELIGSKFEVFYSEVLIQLENLEAKIARENENKAKNL